MTDQDIIRELRIARELLSRRPMSVTIVEEFTSRLHARMDDLISSRERLERMQFIETGAGGREEDKGITENIERIDHNLDVLDSILYFIKKQARKLK